MFPLYDNNPHQRTPWLTLLIIVINALVMLGVARMSDVDRWKLVVQHGFVPHRVAQLSDPRLTVDVRAENPEKQAELGPAQQARLPVVSLPAEPRQIYLSMFTMMFLHGGWMHLLSNMWFLWIFGNNIEDRLGHVLFALFYVIGGLFALACHWITGPDSNVPVIGASGAVAAVLGAYAITFPKAKVRTLVFLVIIITVVDLPALVVLGFWFLSQLAQAVGQWRLDINGGVAWWAHIGGFAAGLALMPLLALIVPPPKDELIKEAETLLRPLGG